MKTLYIDCTAGISGKRLIRALLDLKRENADGFNQRMSWLRRYGCTWTGGPNGWGSIEAEPFSSSCRAIGFSEIEALLDESKLLPAAKTRALSAFNALKSIGCSFCGNESGLPFLDACLAFEIVGALALLDMLRVDSVYVSPVNVAGRTSDPRQDSMSALVSFFLKGMTVFAHEGKHERTTLSGALLLKALSVSTEPLPAGRLTAGGCEKDLARENSEALHVMLLEQNGKEALPYLTGKIVVMETNIDDMNPQDYQNLEERLFAHGALDVFFTPILMKKLRPAVRLICISRASDREKLGEIILRYSTTIGLRWSEINRMTLKRRIQKFESSLGPVSMKVSCWGSEIVRVTAEYEDLKRISQETGCPLDQLRLLVVSEFRQKEDL